MLGTVHLQCIHFAAPVSATTVKGHDPIPVTTGIMAIGEFPKNTELTGDKHSHNRRRLQRCYKDPTTHPVVAMEIVINDSKAFPGVVAPVSPAHQVLDHQTHVNQSDFIVWREMTLLDGTETKMNECEETS